MPKTRSEQRLQKCSQNCKRWRHKMQFYSTQKVEVKSHFNGLLFLQGRIHRFPRPKLFLFATFFSLFENDLKEYRPPLQKQPRLGLIIAVPHISNIFPDTENIFQFLGPRHTSDFHKQYCDKKTKRHCDNKIKRHFSSNIFFLCVYWKSQIMVVSADFEKQRQYFDKKLSFYRNIALSQYRFIAILLVKTARVTRTLRKKYFFFWSENEKRKKYQTSENNN